MSGDKRARYQFSVIRERMSQHSGQVLNFALGNLHQKLPESLLRLVSSGASEMMRRASLAEYHQLGEQASAYLSREFGVVVEPEQILPVPGGRAAMTAMTACLLAPGDGVLVTEPGYPAFAQVAAHRHCRIQVAALDPTRDFLPDLSGLQSDELAPIDLVSLNYPNNPTAAVLTPETVTALADRLERHPILFNDATYGPLVYDQRPISLLDDSLEISDGQSVAELHSMAKLFPLGPVALAFLIGSERIINQVRRYSDFAWAPLSALHLQVAISALDEEDYLEGVRDLYQGRIERLRGLLADLGFTPYPTPSGMYVLTDAPVAVAGQSVGTAQEAADVLLDRFGLAVAAWDIPPNRYLRFSALYQEEDLAALSKLQDELLLG
jgi:aspartate/methionine/tyrosine aminotransferase